MHFPWAERRRRQRGSSGELPVGTSGGFITDREEIGVKTPEGFPIYGELPSWDWVMAELRLSLGLGRKKLGLLFLASSWSTWCAFVDQ